MVQSVLPLGFSRNKQHIQNLSVILAKALSSVESVRIFDQSPHLVDLFISVITFWLTEPTIKKEMFVVQSLIELLDALVYSPTFWNKFKHAQILHSFIQIQLRPDLNTMTKSKILRIIQILSLREHRLIPAPPENLRPKHDESFNRDRIDKWDGGVLPQQSQLQPVYEVMQPQATSYQNAEPPSMSTPQKPLYADQSPYYNQNLPATPTLG